MVCVYSNLSIQINCNEQQSIKWYDDVRKSHGSVESSTQGHVQLILRCGMYNIGISDPNCTKYLCVTCNSEDTTSKTTYSADELQDLNSTLYLMRMSGDVKDKMELFQKVIFSSIILLPLHRLKRHSHKVNVTVVPWLHWEYGNYSIWGYHIIRGRSPRKYMTSWGWLTPNTTMTQLTCILRYVRSLGSRLKFFSAANMLFM